MVHGQHNGTKVELDQLLYELHFLIQRKLEMAEDVLYHSCTFIFMTMKSPAALLIKTFCLGFRNVVQDSSPPEPEVIRRFCHIIQNLERVVKIILVSLAFFYFHSVQQAQLRKNNLQQSGVEQKLKTGGRF